MDNWDRDDKLMAIAVSVAVTIIMAVVIGFGMMPLPGWWIN